MMWLEILLVTALVCYAIMAGAVYHYVYNNTPSTRALSLLRGALWPLLFLFGWP
jgi:hypothetical protein